MPVLSWAHAAFWSGAVGGVEPPPVAGASIQGGYVPWQANIVMSLLIMGVLLAREK
jgi:hypothetical protein